MTSEQELAWLLPVAVVGIPAVLTLLGSIITREARMPRPVRVLTQLAVALEKLPVEGEAHKALDGMMRDYVAVVKPGLTAVRKVNKVNVAITAVFFALSLWAMFGLSQWIITSVNGPWNWVAWTITAICAVIFLVFNSAAIATIYNPPTERKK